ncbi:hypothetical protein B0E49_06695 [Polaromonas sp. C04]|nr:hypothetical protein B0E49_06695 [Polaromonas sp. C04]
MLLSVGSLALLSKFVPVDIELSILAVLLPLVVIRLPHDFRMSERAISFAVIALMSILAVELPALLSWNAVVGMGLLILAAAASKWLRGRGRAFAIAGVGAGLAVRLALITPQTHAGTNEPTRAVLTIAVVVLAYGWVGILDWLVPRMAVHRERGAHPKSALHAAELARRNEARRSATVQMSLAMACACLTGPVLFADHWTWSALSAFLVLNGTLVRAEVLNKGVHRLVGAAAGTVGASMVAGVFAANSPATLAALLAILTVSIGLRPVGYAWWVAGLTASLSLLYSYQGQDAAALLGTRLMALSTGAVLAIAVAWFVLPVRGKPQSAGMR